ncbi:hypothetical protein [Micromonospora endolithica]|uniref:Minor tail protein n=1 Tax=Micromonospora endolithica TaxID=230091 RepID=A0A3A9YT65_9ACTN|nr:hypothetical protein [Micromonospora endolithica]RKN38446.1 hypothetical protein D7223_31060 [Micromonospora endolithica]TWJ23134.1 hypothetical protein JD76_03263 [Micromonospora endolithica]
MSTVLATATTAKSGSTVTATVNGIVTTIEVARDLPVASGDVLLVERVGAQWYAYARVYAAAPAALDPVVEPPPPPKPAVTTGTLVVSPVETRSYRPTYGWRDDNTDVYQGEYGGWGNHTGAAFYGTKPRSLAGATVTRATIRVKRLTAGAYAAQSTTLRLVTQATRPGGAPTLTSSTSGPSLAVGGSTTFTVPASWAQAMVDGTAGGLAVYDSDGSPYVRFAGRGSWSPAFTLTITWQRG